MKKSHQTCNYSRLLAKEPNQPTKKNPTPPKTHKNKQSQTKQKTTPCFFPSASFSCLFNIVWVVTGKRTLLKDIIQLNFLNR